MIPSNPNREKTILDRKRPRIHAELSENSVSLGSFIGDENLVIGRSARADLIVPTAPVSQIHAMIRLNKNSELCLYDLGSENGTFINGKRIVEQSIASGTTFQVGTYAIKVNLVDLAPDNLKFHGNDFFWQNRCSNPELLSLTQNQAGHVRGETQVAAGKKLSEKNSTRTLGISLSLATQFSGNELITSFNLPKDCTAEVYDAFNNLLRVIEEGNLTFSHLEKVRLVFNYIEEETFLYWREKGERSSRRALDADSETLWKTTAASFVLGLILASISYFTGNKKEQMEEALIPKSSYLRTTLDSAPAPKGDTTEASAEKSAEPSAPNKNVAQTPSTATNISSALSKMFNSKTSISAEALNSAVGKVGEKSVRSLSSSTAKTEQIGGGGATGVAANASALAASLSKGGSGKVGGKGFGNGTGIGLGSGGTGFGGKGFDLNLGGDEADAVGGLDKALIAAVVQANIGQIKHCYERQLIVDPNIFGKVVAGWTINKDGLVSSSSVKKTTMNNAPVENCILSKIKTWQFPKPNGGGQVLVTYPFLFKSLN